MCAIRYSSTKAIIFTIFGFGRHIWLWCSIADFKLLPRKLTTFFLLNKVDYTLFSVVIFMTTLKTAILHHSHTYSIIYKMNEAILFISIAQCI